MRIRSSILRNSLSSSSSFLRRVTLTDTKTAAHKLPLFAFFNKERHVSSDVSLNVPAFRRRLEQVAVEFRGPARSTTSAYRFNLGRQIAESLCILLVAP